jgi:hypothetical protein
LKIGDIGPGGGIVFYIEGTRALEVSANLGSHSWYNALDVAKNYKGGGFSDWYLPTKTELNLIYQNLIKTGILNDTTWHWSSSQTGNSTAWDLRFFDGSQEYRSSKDDAESVRAVRAF